MSSNLTVRGSVVVVALAALVGLGAPGCGNGEGVASGGQCFLAADCASGLVCIPKGSIRVCSSNLTTVETEIDAGMDVANPGDTGVPPPPPATTPPADTGTVDTGTVEAAAPKDTGAPEVTAPKDSATPG